MKRVILLQIIFGFLNKTVICDFLNLCCPEGSIYTQIVSPNQVKSEWITGFIGREKVKLLLRLIGERPPMHAMYDNCCGKYREAPILI